MTHSTPCPTLPIPADAKDAIVWLRQITKWIGPGFHPDTDSLDYVLEDGSQVFSASEGVRFDLDLYRSFLLLDAEGKNPYDVAIKVQRRLLGMPLPA